MGFEEEVKQNGAQASFDEGEGEVTVRAGRRRARREKDSVPPSRTRGEEKSEREKIAPERQAQRVVTSSSEFGYLFNDDKPERRNERSSSLAHKLDALAYDEKTDGDKYDSFFENETGVSIFEEARPSRRRFSKNDRNSRVRPEPAEAQFEQTEEYAAAEPEETAPLPEEVFEIPEETKMHEYEDVSQRIPNVEDNDAEEYEDEEEEEYLSAVMPYQAYSPYPPQYAPYPPQYAPYPPQYAPYPPQYAPYPPQYSPYPPQYAPYPPQYAPYPPQYAPYPPQQCPMGYMYQPGAASVPQRPARTRVSPARQAARKYGTLPYDEEPVRSERQPEPQPQPEPEPVVEPQPEPVIETKPEPAAQTAPEHSVLKFEVIPEPVQADYYEPEQTEQSAPEPVYEPEPAPEPAPETPQPSGEGSSRFNSRRSRRQAEPAAAAPVSEESEQEIVIEISAEPDAPGDTDAAAPAPSGGSPRFNRRRRS